MKTTTRRTVGLLLLLSLLLPLQFTSAQDTTEVLSLKLKKDFGFAMGGRIQGSFTLFASGPADLHSVDFIIDDTIVFQDDESPFEYQFHTSDFELGVHRIQAVGATIASGIVQSEELQFEFVSADQSWEAAKSVIIPLFILIVVLAVIGISATTLMDRKKGFRIGEYGTSGGAVCSRCGLPFSRHVLSLNLVFGKLERCPHCGKWGIVRRATAKELARAESRFQDDRQQGRIEPGDDETNWKRMIEESRYEEH
jgi:hypothetical protein